MPGLAGEAGAAAGRPGGSGGAAGPARRRVWLPRSLPPRSPLGARPGRGLGAASLHLALRAVASGCVGRSLLGRRSVLGSSAAFGQGRARLALLRPARYAPARPWPCRACAPSRRPSSVASSLPAARCSGLRSPSRRLRPLAVAARLRVALRRSLPRRPPLGARALAPPDPPGRPAATSSHSRQPRLDRRPHPRPAGHGGNGGNPPDRRPPTLATPTANAGNANAARTTQPAAQAGTQPAAQTTTHLTC